MISLSIFGCQKYSAKPIEKKKIIEEAELADDAMLNRLSLTPFSALLEVASRNNPDLQLLKLQYQNQEKYAKTKNPLLNPTIGLGVNKGFGIEGATQSLTQPFITLGFTVPLWGKRKLIKELEFLEAIATQQEYIILHRNIYLELRQTYTKLRIKYTQAEMLGALNKFLANELQLTEKQMLMGQLSLLDLGLIKADYEQSVMEEKSLEQEIQLLQSKLSGLCGLPINKLGVLKIPILDIKKIDLINRENALSHLIENSPSLNRLHAKYDIAEKILALEIRKQYPDLQIESGFEKEPGESTKYLGIGLGMEVPIFDRNQKGILLAHQNREQILLEYQLQARKSILEMDTALAMLASLGVQIEYFNKQQVKTLANNYELGKLDYQNNKIAKAELISLRKSYYEGNKEAIKILEQYYENFATLEMAIGTVLINHDNLPNDLDFNNVKISSEVSQPKEKSNVKK